MSSQTREEKIVFGVSYEGQGGDGVPFILMGIPRGAWEYMKDGKTHTFDLTTVGVPVKIMLFGAVDHADALDLMKQAVDIDKGAIDLDRDFSIKDRP